MGPKDVIGFIGLHASFPVTGTARRSQILQALLGLDGPMPFKEMKYGQNLGKIIKAEFAAETFQQVLRSIASGDIDYLDLIPYSVHANWVESFRQSVSVSWTSSFYEIKHRPLSPVEERFGFAGTITVTYPLQRFSLDSKSLFQRNLLNLIKRLFVEQKMNWCFVHQGQRKVHPSSIGVDDVFLETRNGFPFSSFDKDLYTFSRYSKEFVRGAFWANFLNPTQVGLLGGISRITREAPCSIKEELGSDRVVLQVGPSPRTADELSAARDYQRLRAFLKPILLETPEEWGRVHTEAIASWKAPRLTDVEWKKILSTHLGRASI